MKFGNLITAFLLLAGISAQGQVIVADNYNVAGNGAGFSFNSGINTGINPPTTRLTGTTASNLRYISTGTKTDAAFGIAGSKLRVTPAANPGRFTLSADGAIPFDFASALGSVTATSENPVIYDLSISMANNSAGTPRFSFALGVAEGDATTWDFGIQLYRTAASDNFYTIGKRIDVAASGLSSDVNTFITNTAVGTHGSEIHFLMRVTDAGSEAATFNSRVQLSMDEGLTWFYDTQSDPDLSNGWRLNGAGRFIIWDVAPNAGDVTYDNFSVMPVAISTVLLSPSDNAQNIGASPTLRVAVSNAAPSNLAVTFYGRELPQPAAGSDFVIAVLPDTQNYAREASGSGNAVKEMWFAQTDWIVANRVSQNIAYVTQLGDCVQNGDIKNGSPNTTEWRNATNAMYRLENQSKTLLNYGIPYGIVVGNHDQDPTGDLDGTTTLYNQYFGIAHFSGRPYYGGHYHTNNDNHFDLFSAGGLDFIVLYFEFGRHGSLVLNWANSVLATNQHRRAFVVTHHAGSDSTPSSLSNHGAALYEGLKHNTNFFMMLGGHVFNGPGEGEGSRANTFNGRTVRTLVSNYQGRFNGGNGLMRLMYFSPSNNTVNIKTYSPWTDTFETDANSQFSFNYNMQSGSSGSPGTPYAALGTNLNVASGNQSAFVWPGLQANKTYEWHVKVTDEFGNTMNSSARQFTTTVNAAPVANYQMLTIVGDQPSQLTLLASDANGDALTFQTNSHPVRGLNTNFDPVSGTITYLPAHGFRGFDRFSYRANDSVANSPIVNFDLNVVAPPDTNSNGLPDFWETKYGVTNPIADDDADGQSNLAEYIANTNPTNAASVLRILGGAWQSNNAFGISWSSIGGTRYRVQFSDADADGSVSESFTDVLRFIDSEMDPNPNGSASTQIFTDTLLPAEAATNRARYYRIKVVP